MNSAPVCTVCPHACSPKEGSYGLCGARKRVGDSIICDNYGKITSMALDPIEKKPLRKFHPGSKILSVGSYGCNLFCPFCQNCEISRATCDSVNFQEISPDDLTESALSLRSFGNIGIAYTYNEPLIGFEYVRDAARAAHSQGLLNVLVTNGYVCEEPFRELLPLIDAMNIDLKASDDEGYRKLGGHLSPVLSAIRAGSASCHVEVTQLIVPGLNDTEDSMRRTAEILREIDENIPLHVTRFFPAYRMSRENPTPKETVLRLARIARESLPFVYEGNL